MEKEREEEKAAFENRMKEELEDAHCKAGRLRSTVARLKKARTIDRLIAEQYDDTYIENRFKEKHEEYTRLQNKFEALCEEKDQLLQAVQESERCLHLEYRMKEAVMMKEAEERRKCWLKEKKEAEVRERAIIKKADHRIEQVQKESEQMRAELKRLSEEAQTAMKAEFEEQVRVLKKDFSERAMRLLKASKEREDKLQAELAEEIVLKKQAEANYKKAVQEKEFISESLEKERDEWLAEKANMAKKNETTIARQAAVEQQLQGQETRRQEEKLKGRLDKKRLCNVIDELRTKLRDQAIDSVNERRNVENAWTVEREVLNEKYSTLESEVQFRQTIHDARLENEHRRQEEGKARAADENERLIQMIDAYGVLLKESETEHLKELRMLERAYDDRLNDQERRCETVVDELLIHQNVERRLSEEIKCKESVIVELERQLDWQKKGTNSWISIMNSHHKAEMDDVKGKLNEEASRHKRTVTELERKLDWQKKGINSWVSIMKIHQKLEMNDSKHKLDSCECDLSIVNGRNRQLQAKFTWQKTENDRRTSILENKLRAEIRRLNCRLQQLESEHCIAKASTHYFTEKLKQKNESLQQVVSIHEDSLRVAINKGNAQVQQFGEECKELKAQIAQKDAELSKCKDKFEQRETDVERRESNLKSWERSLNGREEALQRKELLTKNAADDLCKQEIDLNNQKEKLRQEELSIIEREDKLIIEKGELDERLSEIDNEKERLEDLEIDIEQREKEARRSSDCFCKIPDRLPFNPDGFNIVNGSTEQLAALEKELRRQEWYFLARENEYQDARVEIKRYRMREEKLKSMEEELQKKERALQEMEVQIQLKDSWIKSTMLEVKGIRDTLKMDHRYTFCKAMKNRGTQVSEVRPGHFRFISSVAFAIHIQS
jgi:hypothetical protein